VLTILLVAVPVRAADGRNTLPKTSIPKIARIGKVRIGYSTQEDFAKQWGEGKTITGGHSNSGRVWRVKGTRWILSTDGFEYSERGLVVDNLSLCEDPKMPGDAPFARLSKNDLCWLGEISPGMTKDEVMQIVKRKKVSIMTTKEGCEIRAQGFYALSSINAPLRKWRATLRFSNGSLSALHLDASPDWKP
jgi:hypothetical protein